MDELEWMNDISVNVVDYFVKGTYYRMGKLYVDSCNDTDYEFKYHVYRQAQTYDDGRGVLQFVDGDGSRHEFTPLYIENQLVKYGLTLYSL
jgi:hypothetical protein